MKIVRTLQSGTKIARAEWTRHRRERGTPLTGNALLFGTLGVLGAFGMYLFATSGNQVSSGWAFAIAMLAAAVLVTVIHVYD